MPIRRFLTEKSFDPETIQTMDTAFRAVCSDLGLSDKTDGACGMVAKRVIDLTDRQRDPEAIRQAVLASINAKGARASIIFLSYRFEPSRCSRVPH